MKEIIKQITYVFWASLVAQIVNNLPAMQKIWIQSLGWDNPLEKGMVTPPVFLPGEFHGQRSLAGYSPWGHKELDTTKQLTLTHTSSTLKPSIQKTKFLASGPISS